MVILIIAALAAVGFFVLFVATKRTKVKTILGIICAAIFTCSIVLAVMNESTMHFGMVKKTTTTSQELVSLMPEANIIMKQPIDKNNNYIYAYKVKGNDKVQKTEIDTKYHVKDMAVANGPAVIETKTTYYDYKNNIFKKLFFYPDTKKEVSRVDVTFKLPADWHLMTNKLSK